MSEYLLKYVQEEIDRVVPEIQAKVEENMAHSEGFDKNKVEWKPASGRDGYLYELYYGDKDYKTRYGAIVFGMNNEGGKYFVNITFDPNK